MSNDLIVGLVVAVIGGGGLGALVDRFLLRRPVSDKLAAETRQMDASTTQTITSIVEGLLITMQAELDECVKAHAVTRKELGQARADLERTESALADSEARAADLQSELTELSERLIATEQQENQ